VQCVHVAVVPGLTKSTCVVARDHMDVHAAGKADDKDQVAV
jgi:hypothetical protein